MMKLCSGLVVYLMILGILFILGCGVPSDSSLNDTGGKSDFCIPSGPAKETLMMAAKQGGVELFLTLEDVEGVSTQAVEGEYTLEELFGSMLKGSDIEVYRMSDQDTFTTRKRISGKSSFLTVPEPNKIVYLTTT